MNGAVKGRMSIMLIGNFVILRSNMIMLEKHKWYRTVQRKKHIEAMKHILDLKQSKLLFSSAQLGESSTPSTSKALAVTFPGVDSLKAEVLWLLKLVVSNFSFRSTDKIGGLFQAMFPDSKIAAKFSLG